ncbi:Hypothetical predicted protein [Pelobates cultripes]|uniref:Uncharacterized protein n=1 Tax=Pelobates cultripes TaxID=61616 RepID=A0AAD1S829_PELCU|nr:Hypothetical predicted protein [Pelobates cultripes]
MTSFTGGEPPKLKPAGSEVIVIPPEQKQTPNARGMKEQTTASKRCRSTNKYTQEVAGSDGTGDTQLHRPTRGAHTATKRHRLTLDLLPGIVTTVTQPPMPQTNSHEPQPLLICLTCSIIGELDKSAHRYER